MYARLVTTLGWTWEFIDTDVTLPHVIALLDYWHETPPIHEAFAAFCGIERTGALPRGRGVATPTHAVRDARESRDVPADNNPAFAHLLAASGMAFPPGFLDAKPDAPVVPDGG